ncbi:hypothetical protein NDU88_005605 [Pleurodeles waltl]|uniref:Uncharacterized protein n=1 Tax=Pleurodeles waltl TaxID=8319 RepID=A0AAV7LXS3_PLEWA|nr:hypothetical protein NDU88_005605 [Pleurodeles waltl]
MSRRAPYLRPSPHTSGPPLLRHQGGRGGLQPLSHRLFTAPTRPLRVLEAPRHCWVRGPATAHQATLPVRSLRPPHPPIACQSVIQPLSAFPGSSRRPLALGDALAGRAQDRYAAAEARAAELTDTRLLTRPSWPPSPPKINF